MYFKTKSARRTKVWKWEFERISLDRQLQFHLCEKGEKFFGEEKFFFVLDQPIPEIKIQTKGLICKA